MASSLHAARGRTRLFTCVILGVLFVSKGLGVGVGATATVGLRLGLEERERDVLVQQQQQGSTDRHKIIENDAPPPPPIQPPPIVPLQSNFEGLVNPFIPSPPPPAPAQDDSTTSPQLQHQAHCLPPPWERNLTEHPVLVVGGAGSGWPPSPAEWEPKQPCIIPCLHTSDQTYIDRADVRLYEILLSNYPTSKEGLPKRSCEHQKFALLSMESADNYPFLNDAKSVGYDITMDYRLTSDVPIPYYGICDVLRPVDTTIPKHTDVLASAFISNCGARNNRKEVVEELMKYIKVDSFGACLHNQDIPDYAIDLNPWDQKTAVLKRYKFNLAFENSNSEDYVTEKFYQPLESGTVPVFLGTSSIPRFAPHPSSYIDASSFPSIRALADHLLYLASNDTAYNAYFAYKDPAHEQAEEFMRVAAFQQVHSSCRLCMKAAGMDVGDYIAMKKVVLRG
ncbi:uncharacterized protein EV422DRAFT_48540 [Fimicolochytrium jonesii]|uniref:uncharacterized protein n=1 Tax=Fimicolochytrium jonesii TaxID=1396493 RepID=UPI0022FE079F|nr:uncharacterized protein EV422DRAFT_48540 [Fimicolochytrium jonesii]KAI8820992.1 hypothetical protein EV422DRAFT_48540 [Fimicolochytrium jonesii]